MDVSEEDHTGKALNAQASARKDDRAASEEHPSRAEMRRWAEMGFAVCYALNRQSLYGALEAGSDVPPAGPPARREADRSHPNAL